MEPSPLDPIAASRPSRSKATVISAAIIVAATLLAYSNSYSGPFVFDDVPTIVENPTIRQLHPLKSVLFEGPLTAFGRPLLNLSFALNYAWGELNVTSYHVVNVLAHLLAGLVLFGIVRRTLEQVAVPSALQQQATLVALFCSLLWTLHPLQTESVTYVVQRGEAFVGLFYLLVLYCSIRARDSEHSFLWGLAAVVACVCGVASKEVIVSAPLAVVVYDWAFTGQSLRSLVKSRRWLYAALFSTWIPLFLLVPLKRESHAGFGQGLTAWDYAMTQWGAITHYLRLALWPDALALDYDALVTRDPREIVPHAIVVGLLAAAAIVAIKYQRWIAFLGFVFFAALSPSSSFIPLVTQTVAEHRIYVSLTAVVVLLVVAFWQACGWATRRWWPATGSSRMATIVPAIVLSVVSLGLGARTFARNAEYSDAVRLWTTNVERAPDSVRPYIQIAMVHLHEDPRAAIKWFDRAEQAFERSRSRNRLTPFFEKHLTSICSGRATAYANLGDFQNALVNFDRSLELDPSWANAHFYRAMVLVQLGRDADALASITKSLELETGPDQLFVRGEILSRMRHYADALEDLNRAIEMGGANPVWYQSRGRCLTELDRYQDAVANFSEAIRLHPGFAKAYIGRGMAFARTGRHALAVQDFSQAIHFAPAASEAYAARASSLLSLGRLDLARRDVEALELLPGGVDPELRKQLDQASTPPAAGNPQQQK